MRLKPLILTSLASLGLLLSLAVGTPAQMGHGSTDMAQPTSQFQRIEQPLWSKLAVTGAGLGLIGLELWWFLFSKPQSRQVSKDGDLDPSDSGA
ncbi:hypothetical protein [Leptolyngbya sp. KIOST-1]|uniref:hypothetical protein n=1 Tax=Leptolyngbya sp. KIOST-1 TaxID=1229172 RepID=UPI0006905BA9|nr:hypothetical protein [Leptolyngbya sp. KIOST-1]